MNIVERAKWAPKWTINKYKDVDGKIAEALKAGASTEDFNAFETLEFEGNLLLNTGIDEIWDLVNGDSTNVFSNDLCKIGVGDDGTTAASASQTDLQGASTAYVTMDDTYPTSATQATNYRSTFDTSTGNFHWNEFTIKQDTSSICLNRKLSDKGTKVVGETWSVTLTITLS